MATASAGSLLERRLVIVTGKGGTGKTTVAAALALAATRTGRRVLVVEVGPDEQIPRLLDPDSPPLGPAGRRLAPGLHAIRIEPFTALAEYLGLQLGVRALVDLVIRNTAFRQLMTAAPGWRELITLGKIWHLAQLEESPGRPRHELIVVDAPATGHGVSFLETPHVVVSAVRAGPLRHQTEAVMQMIQDPEQTVVLPVTLAEELPTRETAELVGRIRELGIPVDRVVVNAWVEPPFAEDLGALDEVLERLDTRLQLGALPTPGTLASCARYLRARHELNRGYISEITRVTDLPIVRLPQLALGIQGPAEIARLAAAITADPEPLAS